MLEQTSRLLLHQLRNHVAQHRPHGVETLVRGADVVEAVIVQQNLLNDEDGNRLAKFRACLHDTKAKRDNLCGQEEVDDLGGIVLDQRANDAQRRQAEVFERPRLGGRVEEGVEVERNVCFVNVSATPFTAQQTPPHLQPSTTGL